MAETARLKVLESNLTILGLLTVLAALLSYCFACGDQCTQLPIIYRVIDSNYLKSDWFLNETSGFNVRYYYSHLLAWISQFISLHSAYFIIWITCLLAQMYSLVGICEQLFASRKPALFLIAAAFVGPRIGIGGMWFFSELLIPGLVAETLVLLSLLAALRGPSLVPGALIGIASIFQLAIGLFAFPLIFLTSWLSYPGFRKRLLVSLGMFVILIAPNLLQMYAWQLSSEVPISDEVKILSVIRHPWHFTPSAFPVKDYYNFAALLLSLVVTTKLFRSFHTRAFIYRFIGLALAFSLMGFLVPFVPMELQALGKFQFFRVVPYISLLGLAGLGGLLYQHSQRKLSLRASVVLALLCLCMFYEDTFIVGLLGVLGFRHLPFDKHENTYVYTVIVCALGTIFYSYNPTFFRNPRTLVFVMSAYSVIGIDSLLLDRWSRWKLLTKSAPALSVLVMLCYVCFKLMPQGPSINVNSRDQMYAWIREGTSADSVFVIPPYLEDFRLKAERAIVVDFKGYPFNASGAVEWRNRILETVIDEDLEDPVADRMLQMKQGFFKQSADTITQFADKYGAEFVLWDKQFGVLTFPILHENADYVLYSLSFNKY